MRTVITLTILLFTLTQTAYSQISAKLMQYMDVSSDQITFVYGGDTGIFFMIRTCSRWIGMN